MTTSQDKVYNILEHLYYELTRGYSYFQIAKNLIRAFDNHQLTGTFFFFESTYDACLRESILSISKLTVPHKESVNIAYLLNVALRNCRGFRRATSEKVKKTVAQHNKRLVELHDFIESVEGPRNHTIAHLDKNHINNPNVIISDQVNMTEVGQYFEELLQMVNTYKSYYDGSEYGLESIERGVQRDIDYLITLMEDTHE